MNYALLSKYRVMNDPTGLDEIVNRVRLFLASRHNPGLYETLIYQSSQDLEVIFILSMWYELSDLGRELNTAPELLEKLDIKVAEQYSFELIQEYRQADAKIEASFIRLVTFPVLKTAETHIQETTDTKKRRAEIGYVGGWAGRSLTDPHLILSRVDWASLAAQQNFFVSEILRPFRDWYLSQGAQIEYASTELRALIPAQAAS
jgi:hypothetical protein